LNIAKNLENSCNFLTRRLKYDHSAHLVYAIITNRTFGEYQMTIIAILVTGNKSMQEKRITQENFLY